MKTFTNRTSLLIIALTLFVFASCSKARVDSFIEFNKDSTANQDSTKQKNFND